MLISLSLLFFSGCDAIRTKFNEIENYANEFVSIGFYLGVEDISTPLIDTDFLGLEELAGVQMYLATASSSQQISSNPVSRANVTLSSPLNDQIRIPEITAGQYGADSASNLVYDVGETAIFDIDHASIFHSISVNAPEKPDFTLAQSHSENTPLTISFTNQPYENTLAIVINALTGDVTYDNRPTTAQDLYDLTHPQGLLLNEAEPEIDTIEIPGSAFADDGVYVVAVAGIMSARPSQMENINTAISGMIAGEFNVEALCIPNCETFQ